jgi:HSP90 family molecular chaperone
LIENSVPKDNKNDYKNLNDDEIETADLAHLEPKLREAWIKMRKLDKILERVCKKERMVKKETINLIEKNRADLHQLRLTSDHKESKQEAENTAHFLALSYFDLDDEIERDEITNLNEDEPMMTPVFKTQVPYNMDDLISNSDNKNAEPSISSQVLNLNTLLLIINLINFAKIY